MKEMQNVNIEELDDLYQDIEDLRQQIHKLETVIAYLIHEVVYDNRHGVGRSDINKLTSNSIKQRQEISQKLIEEVGGERKLIEIFLNLSKNNPDTK